MNITGVYQFPQNGCICTECGCMCWTEQKNGKVVVSHPTRPSCSFSHKAFEVPLTKCDLLPDEFFSDQIG
jgi:hypothetical protein